MYGTLVVTLIAAPFNPRFYVALKRFVWLELPVAVLGLGIFVLIVWAIARRRQNWLRWSMFLIFLLDLPKSIPNNLRMASSDPLNAWLNLLAIVVMCVAYFFIFTGDAVPWFQKPMAAAE
jgi:hypothetical protein